MGCAALSYPEVAEKPIGVRVSCNTSGVLRRIYFPLQVTQLCISWSGLSPLGEQTHSSAFQLNARPAMCLIDKPSTFLFSTIHSPTDEFFFHHLLEMWEAAGTRIHERKQQHFRHFKNRKIKKVEPSEADKAHNPLPGG